MNYPGEEKKLIEEFGEAYKKYQKDVPMLLPNIKKRKSHFRQENDS